MPRSLGQGRFQLTRVIGRGRRAQVWRARDAERGRAVAIKLLVPRAPAEDRERFLATGRLHAALDHPGILAAEPPAREGTAIYQCLELASSSLAERVQTGSIDIRTAARALVPVLRGMHQLHEAGNVHLDVTPRNLLLRRDETLVLTDFGEATAVSSQVRREGAWCAPELADGGPAAPSMDIYGIGAVLFTVATRARPYGVHRDPNALLALPDLLRIPLGRAFDADPAQRWSSAAAFADSLSELT